MSGGSFNYLCHATDLDDLLRKRIDLADMTLELAALGYAKDAAAESERLLRRLNQIEVEFEVALERLRPVWKAMEWWRSSDWGEEQFLEALAAYRGQQIDSEGS